MSKYTTEIRYICEKAAGLDESKGYRSINEILTKAAPLIFDFDYPIFDEDYRLPLEIKILKHFYTREICAETVALWKLWLDSRMNEIMPFFNKLYESELIKFNPMHDTDLTTDHNTKFSGLTEGQTSEQNTGSVVTNKSGDNSKTREDQEQITRAREDEERTLRNKEDANTQNKSGSSEESGSSTVNVTTSDQTDAWNYYSDTPQGAVTGLENLDYLTNATHDTGESSGSSRTQGQTSGSGSTTERVTGSGSEDETINKTGSEDETTNKTGSGSETGIFAEKTTTDNTGAGSSSSNTQITNTEDYLEHIIGKRNGLSFSRMLLEFRDTFLNIDLDVINSLNDLFLNLW